MLWGLRRFGYMVNNPEASVETDASRIVAITRR